MRNSVYLLCFLYLLCLIESTAIAELPSFPGATSDWNGFTRYDFEIAGKPVLVVAPENAAEGHPWVWHGEFFGHKPAPDIALLKRGFHVVYTSIPDMLGCPDAVKHWNTCFTELTSAYGLSNKVALVGLSRGALYCYNWAAANPEQVACMYLDAPVCDFKSWPGGRGQGKDSPRDWALVLDRYGFKDDMEALAYDKNPIDNLASLAAANVPLLHVYGTADDVVPWQENTGLIAERFRRLGGQITLIEKPGIGHHPHGLQDSTPIVDFIVEHAAHNPSPSAVSKPRDPVDELAASLHASRLVVYKSPQERELYLHVFEPEGFQRKDHRPCFVIFHGGGWTGGEPRRMYPFAEHFAQQGMVGVSVQYRLHDPQHGTTVFECVKDGRSAVRFIRQHADEFGIDPERIVVSGGSAGGHIAAGTAIFTVDETSDPTDVSCMPNALVLLFPVIDTSKQGYGYTKIGERWRELSPVHQVTGQLPPTLIFHGTGDTVTPFAGAEAFQKAMLKHDNHCELDINHGGKHGYLMFDRNLYLDTLLKTDRFLSKLELLSK